MVILSDRADEMCDLTDEINGSQPGLLENVRFVMGASRNPDHLRLCNVQSARAVVIIRPPIASETAFEGQEVDASRSAMLNADKHTIITSLNLHLLLSETQTLSKTKEGGDAQAIPTFTLTEIVHESNIIFLRQAEPYSGSRSRSADQGVHCSPSEADKNSFDWQLMANGSIFMHSALDSLMVQAMFNTHILAFWEALTDTGNRGWLKGGREARPCHIQPTQASEAPPRAHEGNQRASQCSPLQDLRVKRRHRRINETSSTQDLVYETCKLDSTLSMCLVEDDDEVTHKSPKHHIEKAAIGRLEIGEDSDSDFEFEQLINADTQQESNGNADGHPAETKSNNAAASSQPHLPVPACLSLPKTHAPEQSHQLEYNHNRDSMDKVSVPPYLFGSSFGRLFVDFLRNDKTIAVALYRRRQHCCRDHDPNIDAGEYSRCRGCEAPDMSLPYVVTAPTADTVIHVDDEVFVLKSY